MRIPYIQGEEFERQADATRHRAFLAGVSPTLPFDVESTVEFLFEYRLNLATELPSGVLGHIDLAAKIMSISQDVGCDGRRRFTIAHEIGHLVLHVPYLSRWDAQSPRSAVIQDRRMEFQADAFAAALLMPREVMFDRFGPAGAGKPGTDITEMMTLFGVSRQAAEIRLRTLGRSE